jgi:hypothetical protein
MVFTSIVVPLTEPDPPASVFVASGKAAAGFTDNAAAFWDNVTDSGDDAVKTTGKFEDPPGESDAPFVILKVPSNAVVSFVQLTGDVAIRNTILDAEAPTSAVPAIN